MAVSYSEQINVDNPMAIHSQQDLIEEIAEAITFMEGEVRPVLDLTAQEVRYVSEDFPDEDFDGEDLFDCFENDEERAEIRSHQLIEIDHLPSYEDYGLMEGFATRHDNDRLFRALEARHPFRAFRNAVEAEGLLEEWYAERDRFHNMKAQEWLDENGIAFVDGKIVQVREDPLL